MYYARKDTDSRVADFKQKKEQEIWLRKNCYCVILCMRWLWELNVSNSEIQWVSCFNTSLSLYSGNNDMRQTWVCEASSSSLPDDVTADSQPREGKRRRNDGDAMTGGFTLLERGGGRRIIVIDDISMWNIKPISLPSALSLSLPLLAQTVTAIYFQLANVKPNPPDNT